MGETMKDDTRNRRRYVAEETEITSDFECGNGEHIRRVSEDHYTVDTRRDCGVGDSYSTMSWVFRVKITNRSNRARTLKLDVRSITHSGHDEAYVWAKRGDTWDRVPAEVLPRANDDWIFRATVRTDAGETLYLSNSYWHTPSEMTAFVTEISEKHAGLCTLSRIGETAQARPISALTISDPESSGKKERILIAASPQGSEIGAWACRHLIEFLLSADPFAEAARRRWTVDVIPQANPDGEALGTEVTPVATHQNLPSRDLSVTPESVCLDIQEPLLVFRVDDLSTRLPERSGPPVLRRRPPAPLSQSRYCRSLRSSR